MEQRDGNEKRQTHQTARRASDPIHEIMALSSKDIPCITIQTRHFVLVTCTLLSKLFSDGWLSEAAWRMYFIRRKRPTHTAQKLANLSWSNFSIRFIMIADSFQDTCRGLPCFLKLCVDGKRSFCFLSCSIGLGPPSKSLSSNRQQEHEFFSVFEELLAGSGWVSQSPKLFSFPKSPKWTLLF